VFGDSLYLALLDDNRPRQLGATGTYSANWLPDRLEAPRRPGRPALAQVAWEPLELIVPARAVFAA